MQLAHSHDAPAVARWKAAMERDAFLLTLGALTGLHLVLFAYELWSRTLSDLPAECWPWHRPARFR